MTINGSLNGYPKGTQTVSSGLSGIQLPVVGAIQSTIRPKSKSFYRSDSEKTLGDLAKEVFFHCFRDEFHELDDTTLGQILWNDNGVNTKHKKYNITEGLRNHKYNRKSIGPFDENRITINGKYINASPVKAGSNEFIAMEAPPPTAFFRFWEMVWRNNVDTILMITSAGKEGFPRYWPQKERTKVLFGRLEVKHRGTTYIPIARTLFGGGTIKLEETVFSIKTAKSKIRHIKHLHFSQWKEDKAPDLTSFLNLTTRVQDCAKNSSGPLVIQSNEGSGRVGTFIAAYSLICDTWRRLSESKKTNEVTVDVKERVRKLRKQRYGMVLTEEQYLFIYKTMKKFADAYRLQKLAIKPIRPHSNKILYT